MPPKLVVSEPADEVANTAGRSSSSRRRRVAGPGSASKEHGRSSPSEWTDVDESPTRRRKKGKRRRATARSSSGSEIEPRIDEGNLGRFFPRLSQILETTESTTSSRPSTRSSDLSQRRDKISARRSRHREDTSSTYRRPVRHRTGGVSRRSESLLRVNPSLLSVLSSLTGNSDRSSGSSSTVTQQSFDRRGSDGSRPATARARYTRSEVESSMPSRSRQRPTNVFDYMETIATEDGHDRHSVASSSSSHYEPSDGGSSEAPGTPSSRSTFPSPTTTRSQSVSELRRKYDTQYAGSTGSVRSESRSPDASIRSLRKQPSVSDVQEDEEEGYMPPTAPSNLTDNRRHRSTSRSSRAAQHSSGHQMDQQQEESMRQHTAYSQQGHYVEPIYGQHRSFSNGSAHSDQSAYGYHMAMQQYQWPPPPDQAMNGHLTPNERPPAPDAPDINRRTLTGYEELALELSTSESPVKPLYRKFEYLNHRILLHLQDELSELEERLRAIDEIIAQMDPAAADGHKTPASRRGEAFHGHGIHLQRTHLLGHIFVKTEQYNKAMSSYATMVKDSAPADDDRIEAYQRWMAKHAPVHEVETRFLEKTRDLIIPGDEPSTLDRSTRHAALAYLPVALMLPLLLYSIIPTLVGRLVVTALIAVGAFIVAATTRIRHLMPARDWAVCGAAYVLLMAAIAGCIPQHTA